MGGAMLRVPPPGAPDGVKGAQSVPRPAQDGASTAGKPPAPALWGAEGAARRLEGVRPRAYHLGRKRRFGRCSRGPESGESWRLGPAVGGVPGTNCRRAERAGEIVETTQCVERGSA